MLERFNTIYRSIEAMALLGFFDDYDIPIPTQSSMVLIRKLLKILSPLERFIRILEGCCLSCLCMTNLWLGEKYLTISLVPGYLHDCLRVLSTFTDSTAKNLYDSIQHRLGFILKEANYALCAAALDPRSFIAKYISKEIQDEVWETLAIWVTEYEAIKPNHHDPLTPQLQVLHNIDHVRSILLGYCKIFENPQNEELLKVEEPLSYWRRQFLSNPDSTLLKQTVLCLFSISATSAPSERCFTQASRTISPIRSSLSPELLESYIIIKSYMENGSLLYFDDILHELE